MRSSVPSPHVQIAAFAEGHQRDATEALTLFRVFDKLNIVVPQGAPPPSPETEFGVLHRCVLVIALKRGNAEAKGHLTIDREVPISPAGTPYRLAESEIAFAGDEGSGANFILEIQNPLVLRRGPNWFVVSIDGREVVRVPLNLGVQ